MPLNRSRVVLVCVLSFLGVLGVFVFIHSRGENAEPGTHHTVILTTDGFSPTSLTIHVGDTVTFATEAGEPFWPASDLHPTHSIYPAFDPKRPLSPGESWSFLFDRAGSWNFHDHLHPTHTGRITVLTEKGRVVEVKCSLTSLTLAQKKQCWEEDFKNVLATEGLARAFALLSDLYATDSDFAKQCHGYAHLLGQEAYRIFTSTGQVTLPPETSYCGYGFYHGFMETMLSATGNLAGARSLCEYAQKTLGGDARGACYHGIGHGLVDGSDPRAHGDARLTIRDALSVCEKIGDTNTLRNRCASGVFNSLAILFDNPYHPESGLSTQKEDPFWLCREQQKEYFALPCYQQMNSVIMRLNGNDLVKSLSYTRAIENTTYAKEAVSSLASILFLHTKVSDFNTATGVAICRSLSERLRLSCFEGFAAGLVEFGPPGHEYEKTLSFCESALLRDSERNACMGRALPYLKMIYSHERMQEVCALMTETDRVRYCTL